MSAKIVKSYTCETCAGQFEAEPIINPFNGKELSVPVICQACLDARDIQIAHQERQKRIVATEAQWEALCPPLYRDTNPADPRLSDRARAALIEWSHDLTKGLGIVGRTGTGKTRLCFLKLRELHFAGVRVMAISAKRMERQIQDSFGEAGPIRTEAREIVDRARVVPVLFLDDVGKERFTDRISGEFYDLIERRTSHLLPTLWTANATGPELVEKMGGEYGEPTVRRLIEFSTIVEA